MKKFLLWVGVLAGFVPVFAVNITAPSSVNSGTSYTVYADHSEYNPWGYGMGIVLLKNGAQVGGGGGSGYGYVSVSVTPPYTSTDYGSQVIHYQAAVSGGSGNYPPANAWVTIIQPNTAPTITWVQNPANAQVNQWFTIQARGNDSDGNLTNVNVWREWNPHAFSGGGNGYEGYSDANGYAHGSPGSVTFMAQSQDSSGATSPVIYHTVNIYAVNGVTFNSNTWPTGSVYVNQGVNFGYNITNSGSKTWGANHYMSLRNSSWTGITFPSVNGWTPGTTGNVPFGFTAPGTPGSYTYYIQALENGVEWFGPLDTKSLTVANRAPINPSITATVNGVNVPNSGYMQLGEAVTLNAGLQDQDGDLAWHAIYYQRTTGASPDPGAWSVLGDGSPSAGGTSTKSYTFTPNQSGRYDYHTNGHDGAGAWGPGASVTVWVLGTANGSVFQSQSVVSAMTTGETYSVSVTMQNAGGSDRAWSVDASPHKLKSVTATNWGVATVALPGGTTVLPSPQTPNTATFTFNVTAPTTPGMYPFQWQMMEDFSGNPALFGALSTLVTVNVTDNDAPSVPTGLSANGSHNAFTLNWTASSDNAGVTLYEIERQGAGVVTSASTTYNFTGLTPSTNYQVRVRARDAAANWSAWTNWLSVTTGFDPLADSDGDGMRNDWENQYFGSHTGGDPTLDPDNDGFTNVAEYNLGKHPLLYDQGTSTLGNAIPGGWPNTPGGANHTANLAVGATAGELNVDKSGAATYSVPIWTTPGTAGMEPKISLNYSSQAGAGVAGFGWSLGGISAISRGPMTQAVDNVIDPVDFDSNDRFYLDGQRLATVAGTHLQAGAEYRTWIETFTKIVANGTAGNGPASFTAWTKAGLIIQFGHTADSVIDAAGRSEKLIWNVNRISDTKGNYMDFVYEKDAANGVHRLSRINYTGNGGILPYASLRFEYEDRPDWSKGYFVGTLSSNLKRLKYIRSYFGESVARTYTLNYVQRDYTGRSLLTSLTEAGSDGVAYPALTFDYGTPTYGWEQPGNFNFMPSYFLADNQGNDGKGYPVGTGFVDLNGDGRTDFVVKRDGTGTDNAQLNTGTGWVDSPDYKLPYPLAIANNSNDTGARFVDFDSDGLVDYVVHKLDANGAVQTRRSWRNNGNGWTEVFGGWLVPSPMARDSSSGSDFYKNSGRFVDVNGDGRPDSVAFITSAGAKTNLSVCLNTGSGWTWNSAYSTLSGSVALADKLARFVDLNGDGLPDIVASYKDGTTVQKYVWLNTGTGWSSNTSYHLPTWIAEKDKPRVGAEFVDLNGDGLQDLLWSRETPAPAVSGFALNTGTGWNVNPSGMGSFLSPAELGRETYGSGGATFMDFNADGLPDILMSRYLSGGSSKSVHIGSGAGWQPTSDTSWQLPVHLLVDGFTSIGADFVDFDGDGVADLVWKRRNANGQEENGLYRNRANPLADRLSKVTNGLGVAATLTYKTLLDSTVYTKGTGGPADSANVTGSMYVVSAVSHDDGVNGQYAINYKYAGLRSHRLQGSLGFEKMTVTDSRTLIRSETTHAQTFPYVGMPIVSQTISGSTVLKDTLIAYDFKWHNTNKTRFIFAKDTDETTYDLDGTLMGSTSTSIPDYTTDIDDYGNIKKIVVDTDGYTKTTTSVFTNSATTWQLGRLTSATVTTMAAGQTTQTRNSSFTYEPGSGLLQTETVQPGDSVLGLTTTYAYDQFGNKTSVTVSGSGLTVDISGNYTPSGTVSRATTTQYDGNGRFPLWTRNALNHQENYTDYDQVKGVLTGMTGANGLATSWAYDGFGRKTQETRADGTVSYTRYRWVSGAPAQAKYLSGANVPVAKYHVETESTGTPPSLAFHDAFGRAFLGLSVNGDGNIVYSTTHHDSMGRAWATSVPYLSSTTASWTRTTSFDLLNRPLTTLTPDDANGDQPTSYSYNGLTVDVTDPKERVTRSVKNSQGWTTENTRNLNADDDAPASSVTYGYDVLGNLKTTVADGVTTSLNYDDRGRKTDMTDADMGTWLYRYNVFGELIWQKDAKGQITTMTYDALGRLTSRVEAEGETNWTYDTSPQGIGKLHTVSAPAGYASSNYTETYLYDNLGRPSELKRTIDGTEYVTQTTYDSVGRVLRTVYPASALGTVSTRNVYNSYGYLKEIRNWIASDDGKPNSQLQGRVYWMADSYAVTGQINGETYGNGLANDRDYSAVTGRLTRATIDRGSVVDAPFFVQDLNYTYDDVGNVKSRIEAATGFARDERFSESNGADGYDGLDRLKVHRIVGGATVTVTYDTKGNITNKSDVGGYSYWANRPHAVKVAGVNSDYTYDAVGNMVTGAGRSLEWTSFNQMKKVTQGTKSSEFAFGAGHERVLQIRKTSGNVTDRTIYVGGLYEKVISVGGLTEHKHYIMGPTGRIAVYTERSNLSKDTRWFHTDGLGSITVITDENGRVLKRHTYDAWGKQSTAYTNTTSGITNTSPSTRGYTDHEMLSDFGLIHMNGRVYDPVLGRFLSADPNIDGVSDAQGYNRYSYVGNNPMNATDPSGYFKLKDFFKAAVAIVVGVIAAIYLGPYAAQFLANAIYGGGAWGALSTGLSNVFLGIGGGLVGGAASGFAGSLLNGGSLGDAFKAGAIGGLVGAVTGGLAGKIGNVFGHEVGSFGNEFGRAVAHGAAGGAIEEIQGGEFRHGFYAGFAGSAGGSITMSGPLQGGSPSRIAARTIVAAVAGGTASELSGGKFANGAVTSAFQHLFNAEGEYLKQLWYDGSMGSALVLFSFDELEERGGNRYVRDMGKDARRFGGRVVALNLDDCPKEMSWATFIGENLRGETFDNIVLQSHGGPNGMGASDPRMAKLFAPDSPLIRAVAPLLNSQSSFRRVWMGQCYGSFPAGYLRALKSSFGGAVIYSSPGLNMNTYPAGLRSNTGKKWIPYLGL